MMSTFEELKAWIDKMAALIDKNESPSPEYYAQFLQDPKLVLKLVELINALDETQVEQQQGYYSACIYALDISVAQLQAALENGSKLADKLLQELMGALARAIESGQHSLSFWLPILNAFYEVHVDLSEELKNAYLVLASEEEDLSPEEEIVHINAIKELIQDLSDLSVFDIAENFFAQSYAMPAEFFTELVMDLYRIEEGQDIALLMLLHPKKEVRDVVVATFDMMMEDIELSDVSLSRLQAIKHWYPESYHAQLNAWMKIQRKKGVMYCQDNGAPIVSLKASEVDGGGAQGLFIHFKQGRQHQLCGLLLKQGTGIKDVWMTSEMSLKEITAYYKEAFDESIMLRDVDMSYMSMIINHFLYLTLENEGMPDLHLLEIQERLGLHFHPKPLDVNHLMESLAVQISPFTPQVIEQSLQRSKSWPKNKRFTESWFEENANIDKWVNACCSFIDGIRVCRFEEAIELVFKEELERHRDKWLFHFLWIALWIKARARKNEKTWQDAFFIAHTIASGTPLSFIPIMQEICRHCVINSIDTMHERKTYLH